MSRKTIKQADTSICHCIIIEHNGAVYAALYNKGKIVPLTFGGEKATEYNNSYWDMWIKAVSYESTQPNDFCLISDNITLSLPEKLKDKVCATENSVWNAELIEQAVEVIHPDFPMEITTDKNIMLCSYITFFPDTPPIKMTAQFAKADMYTEKPVVKTEKKKSQKNARADAKTLPKPDDPIMEDASELAKYFIERLNKDKENGIK